ncbi:hypothetical protein G9A89_019768 [Geosiphon pyriformis]|nr:hypothetical protein G9A89_019768 [Geosiphon pyriformis]
MATGNVCLPLLTISSELLTYDAAATISTTSILNTNLSTDNTSKLLATATIYLLAAASGNISAPTNSNTTTELISKQNPKAKIDPTKLKINYLSLLVTPEDAQPNNPETNQHSTLTSKILPATITENKSLNAIFPFELKEPSTTLLFSGAILEEKPIITMYTNVKVDNHVIKLILDSHQVDHAASVHIITADGVTKTPIGKIDNFPFEVNDIITPIKVLMIEATQY